MNIFFKIKRMTWLRRAVHWPVLRHMRLGIDRLYSCYVRWLSHRGRFKGDSRYDDDCLCVVIITFNVPQLLAKQVDCLRRQIMDKPFHILVGDNSSHRSAREEIEKICGELDLEYVGVPRWLNRCLMNTLFLPSYSHGAALNWLWYKVLKGRRYSLFAFLDHDIFPTHPCCLEQILGSSAFNGVLRRRHKAWYLWPGLALFKGETLRNINVDFLPAYAGKTFLDTGGAMYHRLFKDYRGEMPVFPDVHLVRMRQEDDNDAERDIYHTDCFQYIGNNWLHLVNVTNYTHTEDKSGMIDEILDMI